MISEALWKYQRYGINDDTDQNNDHNFRVNIEKTTRRRSFEYKTKIIGSTSENECRLKAEEH